jgi:hypothetical protein
MKLYGQKTEELRVIERAYRPFPLEFHDMPWACHPEEDHSLDLEGEHSRQDDLSVEEHNTLLVGRHNLEGGQKEDHLADRNSFKDLKAR